MADPRSCEVAVDDEPTAEWLRKEIRVYADVHVSR